MKNFIRNIMFIAPEKLYSTSVIFIDKLLFVIFTSLFQNLSITVYIIHTL